MKRIQDIRIKREITKAKKGGIFFKRGGIFFKRGRILFTKDIIEVKYNGVWHKVPVEKKVKWID